MTLLIEKLLSFTKKYGIPTVFAVVFLVMLIGFNKQVVAERLQVNEERKEIRVVQVEERRAFIDAIERNTTAIQELTVAVTRLDQIHNKDK